MLEMRTHKKMITAVKLTYMGFGGGVMGLGEEHHTTLS